MGQESGWTHKAWCAWHFPWYGLPCRVLYCQRGGSTTRASPTDRTGAVFSAGGWSLGEGLLRLSPSPAPRRLLPGVTRAGLRHAQPPQQRGVGGPGQTETESTHLAFNSIQFQHAKAVSRSLSRPRSTHGRRAAAELPWGEQLCEAFAFWLLTCRAACRGSFQDSRPGHR